VSGQARAGAIDALNKLAGDFAVPMGQPAISKWIDNVVNGTATYDEFKQYLTDMSVGRYPWLTNQIKGGQTVRQLLDPYLQIASSVLGINPDMAQMSDPKWMAALEMQDPKTGERRAMTLAEWQQYLRSQGSYGWGNGAQAHSQAADLVTAIGRAFGKVG
jgi:hypothetical protein